MIYLSRLLHRIHDRASLVMGKFDELKYLHAERIDRLVFVCRGNVCRSPYAEAAAKSLGLQAISCGVDVIRSAPAEATAVHAALLRGKDLAQHTSRSIFELSIGASDCLVAMEPSHLTVACEVAERFGAQVTLMGLWRESPSASIPDPYGRPLCYFNQCFDGIDSALMGLAIKLKTAKLN